MLAQPLALFCVFMHFSAAASLETHETFTEHKSDNEDSGLFIVLLAAKS